MTYPVDEPVSPARPRKPTSAPLALVVDDEASHQLVLKSALQSRGLRVFVAGSGLEALRLLSLHEPQIVLLDLGLPDFDGIELCRRMRLTLRCPIIVVSGDGDESRMVAALDTGADDYVTKPYSVDLLLARVRVAMRHAAAMATAVEQTSFEVGDLYVDVSGHLVVAGGRTVDLSPRQFRLLTALVRNIGQVLTHKQLALVSAADDDSGTAADGLRGAMSHLRKRLGTGPERPRIVTEPHVGYRLLPPGTDVG